MIVNPMPRGVDLYDMTCLIVSVVLSFIFWLLNR
jgi:hypothetical protein